MEKHKADYRNLRHLYLLLGWLVFFILYYLTENFIPPETCHLIHSPLDDRVPFREEFVIFYTGWYLLILFSLIWFLGCSVKSFQRLQTYIIITQVLAMVIFMLYPSRQDLRPAVFPRENIFTAILAILYKLDTNTCVFPSLHVAISVGIASVWLREERATAWVKGLITAFCVGVCVSVAFVKQHSVLDIFGAIPICMIAEWFVFFRKRNAA